MAKINSLINLVALKRKRTSHTLTKRLVFLFFLSKLMKITITTNEMYTCTYYCVCVIIFVEFQLNGLHKWFPNVISLNVCMYVCIKKTKIKHRFVTGRHCKSVKYNNVETSAGSYQLFTCIEFLLDAVLCGVRVLFSSSKGTWTFVTGSTLLN